MLVLAVLVAGLELGKLVLGLGVPVVVEVKPALEVFEPDALKEELRPAVTRLGRVAEDGDCCPPVATPRTAFGKFNIPHLGKYVNEAPSNITNMANRPEPSKPVPRLIFRQRLPDSSKNTIAKVTIALITLFVHKGSAQDLELYVGVGRLFGF